MPQRRAQDCEALLGVASPSSLPRHRRATLVSLLGRDGSSRPRADLGPGLALRAAAERKHRVTYPEFQQARRCRLTVLALEVRGTLPA